MKIIKILLSLMVIFIVGCESVDSSITKVDRKNFEFQDLGIVSKISYSKRGNIIIKQETENKLNYSDSGTDKKTFEEKYKTIVEQYKNTSGIKYEINYGEYEVIEKFTVDYRVAKIEDLKKLPGFLLPASSKEQVNYTDAVVLLVDNGYKRIEE